MASGILAEMTIDQVRAFRPEVVVLGVASTEPHGPVLPYGTDYFQCDAVVREGVTQANAAGAGALMYPTLPIGNNVNFKAFPFACRIGVQTLMQVVLDVIAALEEDAVRKIVLFSGHGGNTDALRAALRAHAQSKGPHPKGAFVCLTSYPPEHFRKSDLVEHPSDHGGEREVSMMMHLQGELVHKDSLGVHKWGELAVKSLAQEGVYFVKPWHLHVPDSAGGDVRKASASKGRQLVQEAGSRLAKLLVELSAAKWTESFPFKSGPKRGKGK